MKTREKKSLRDSIDIKESNLSSESGVAGGLVSNPKAGIVPAFELLPYDAPSYWASRVNAHLTSGVRSLVAAGLDLLAAKAKLGHGKFQQLFEPGVIRIDQRSAEKLMKIAAHPVLSKSTNWSILPPTLNSLAVLSRLDKKRLQGDIEKGKISPQMTIKEATALATEQKPKTKPEKTAKSEGVGAVAASYDIRIPDHLQSSFCEWREWILAQLLICPEYAAPFHSNLETILAAIRNFRATHVTTPSSPEQAEPIQK